MPEDTAKTVISPTLEKNPRENLAGWTESLQDAARAFCASHGPNGALGLASSAAFWLAVHGGAVVARPVHAPPGPLDPAAGPAARINHVAAELLNKDFADAGAKLRVLALESIGPVNRDAIRDPVLGLHAATANSVIASMVAMHGLFSEADIDKFYVRLDKKLVAIEAYDAHIAEYDKVLSLLGLSGVPLTGFPAYRRFLLTLSQFPSFAPHVASYVQAYPDIVNRTVAGITAHLRVHLPSVAASSGANPFAGIAQGTICDEALLATIRPVFTEGKWAGLTRSQLVSALSASGSGGARQPNHTTRGEVSDTTPAGFFYCFKHGHNKTHGWNPTNASLKEACNYMKERPNEFTRAQRAAKTCLECAGGCKYVQKKASIDTASTLPTVLTPSLSLPPPTSRKPQFENPFVSLVDPPPLPSPIHPRDINSKPVTTNVPFVPPPTSPVYTKPLLTTKAKTGETIFDVKGKVIQWSDVVRHASLPASQISTVCAHDDTDMTAAAQYDAQPDHQHDMCLESDARNINLHKCVRPSTPPYPKKITNPPRPITPDSPPPPGNPGTMIPTPPVVLALNDFPDHLALPIPNHAHLLNIRNVADAVFVLKHHRSFGSPTLPTFLQAIRKQWICVPGLTGKIVSQNPPLSIATAQGHLDLVRQGLRSTRSSPSKPNLSSPSLPSLSPKGSEVGGGGCVALLPSSLGCIALVCRQLRAPLSLSPPALFGPTTRSMSTDPSPSLPSDCAITRTVPRSEWAATDLTGRFPIKSRSGSEYILLTTYKGYTHLTPQPNKSAEACVTSFQSIFRFYNSHGHVISHLISDNETSATTRAFFSSPNISCSVQHVSPNNHRANPAERHIRTAKNHIISTLASVHITFPLDLWDRLIPFIELTLNHLQPSHSDPSISAYHGLYGKPCDFLAHPIHPAGQLCYTHVAPLVRKSWDKHSLRAFYIGPALSSYRCHHVYVVSTSSMRISSTLYHFPDPLFHFEDPAMLDPVPLPSSPSRPNPTPDGSDLIGSWFNEPESEGLCQIVGTADPFLKQPEVGNRNPSSPLLAAGYHYMLKYKNATGAVHTTSLTEALDWLNRFPAVPPPAVTPSPAKSVSFAPSPSLRRSTRNRASPLAGGVLSSAGDPQDSSSAPPIQPPLPPCLLSTLCFSWTKSGSLLASFNHMPSRPLSHYSFPPPVSPSPPRSPHPFDSDGTKEGGCDALFEPHPLLAYASNAPTLNLDSHGKPLRFSSAVAGPNRADWIHADVVEITKLVFGTGTLIPVHNPSQSPTYYNRVVREKLKGDAIERRVRGTAGGDRITFPCSVSSSTASLTCFKMLLNDIVSSDSFFGSADATDFYLGADLPDPQSLKIYCDTFDTATLLALGFTPFLKKEPSGKTYVYCDILRTMPGLAISGLLSQLRLLAQLYSHDFIQTATPCLFRHRTRDITFCLVVDDFAIRYKNLDDLQYFTACLGELYHIKVHPECVSFLGFTVNYDRIGRTLSLSYPSYIPDLLTRLDIPNLRTCKSPCVYVPPNFGSKDPQVENKDTSAPASKEELTTLQTIIGSILYYARAVDATMLTAVCLLASQQSAPTANTMAAAYRLLGYAKLHPNHCLVFKPSDMILRIHSL